MVHKIECGLKGESGSTRVRGMQREHGFEARHGGAGMWCDMPVQMFKPGAHKGEVNRGERK